MDNKAGKRVKCHICGKEFALMGLGGHIWRAHTEEGKSFVPGTTGRPAWSKGKTKETDSRIAKQAELLKHRYKTGEITPHFRGKKHKEETKEKISKSRKKYLNEHPDQVPYLLNHYSKGPSYPELYWIELIKNESLDLSYHKQIGLYELDFFNEEVKIDLEIDGSQHYNDPKIIESDARRTEFLESLGWTVIRVNWSEWQKKSELEKQDFVKYLKTLL